jgi:hypothetical protein
MKEVRFVNKTKDTVLAGTFVILKFTKGANRHLELPKDPDVVGFVLADVLPGNWGDAEDVGSEPIEDD